MQHVSSVYIKGDSFIHRLDPRVKLVILAVYSCALFFVASWWGIALMAALFGATLVISRVPFSRVFGCGAIVYVLAALAVVFNTMSFHDGIPALGLEGLEKGCLYGIRVLLLFWMSLLLCFTSTSTGLTTGISKLLAPLRALHVPVDDIALVLSLALRFIPLTSAEYAQIRQAQRARCAHFDDGTLWQRLEAAGNSFVPLFIMLFRRADHLALAMDARCYGSGEAEGMPLRRTSLDRPRIQAPDVFAVVLVSGACIAIALLL